MQQGPPNPKTVSNDNTLEELVTAETLQELYHLASTRILDQLRRERKIPYIKLGNRTIRFSPRAVAEALGRLEVKEVGRPR